MSKDPIGISGGLNQYVFCGNNPVNFRDPLGLCEDSAYTNPSYEFPWLHDLVPDFYDFIAQPGRNFDLWRAEYLFPIHDALANAVGPDRLARFESIMDLLAEGMSTAMMTQSGSMGGGSAAREAAKGAFRRAARGMETKVIRAGRGAGGKIVGVGTKTRGGPTYRPKLDGTYSVGKPGEVLHYRPASGGGFTVNSR